MVGLSLRELFIRPLFLHSKIQQPGRKVSRQAEYRDNSSN